MSNEHNPVAKSPFLQYRQLNLLLITVMLIQRCLIIIINCQLYAQSLVGGYSMSVVERSRIRIE